MKKIFVFLALFLQHLSASEVAPAHLEPIQIAVKPFIDTPPTDNITCQVNFKTPKEIEAAARGIPLEDTREGLYINYQAVEFEITNNSESTIEIKDMHLSQFERYDKTRTFLNTFFKELDISKNRRSRFSLMFLCFFLSRLSFELFAPCSLPGNLPMIFVDLSVSIGSCISSFWVYKDLYKVEAIEMLTKTKPILMPPGRSSRLLFFISNRDLANFRDACLREDIFLVLDYENLDSSKVIVEVPEAAAAAAPNIFDLPENGS
jgi:hypothetical protein